MRFYDQKKLRHIHFEPTRDCNARCPQCARTDKRTLNTIPSLVMDEVNAKELRNLLNSDGFEDIKQVLISGNYGDIVMHTHPRELIEVFIEKNINVHINTNGGALGEVFWSWLGTTNVEVEFAIDGLEDTHHLYRRNTRYDVVMKNAITFINAGGSAHCAMNVFKHNEHQKEELNTRCKNVGFKSIKYRANERFGSIDPLECYDNKGNVTHYLEPTTDYVERFKKQQSAPMKEISWTDTKNNSKAVKCRALIPEALNGSIYISGEFKAWPCCWMEYTEMSDFKNSFRKHSFDTINKEFYEKVTTKWNTPNCLDVCVRKCSVTIVDDRLKNDYKVENVQ